MKHSLIFLLLVLWLNSCGDIDNNQADPAPAENAEKRPDHTVDRKGPALPLEEIGNLRLTSKAHLIVEDNDLYIQAEHLHSENALITTFERPASTMKPGRSGGRIHITAKKASGTLHIRLNGQNGGDGMGGTSGSKGRDGRAGKDGIVKPRTFPHLQSGFSSLRNLQFECKSPPTDGENGDNGTRGQDGSPGHPGGDAARLVLEIEEPSDFEVRVTSEPGRGGKGGSGGRGGRPGRGGRAGRQDELHVCPAAKDGIDGKWGEAGNTGVEGPTGNPQPYCVRIGKEMRGDCVDELR